MTKSVFTPDYRTFLKTLVETRKNQHMTQRVLAEKLNKPQSYVSKFESGERRLDVIETRDILQALNVSVADFWTTLEKEIQ